MVLIRSFSDVAAHVGWAAANRSNFIDKELALSSDTTATTSSVAGLMMFMLCCMNVLFHFIDKPFTDSPYERITRIVHPFGMPLNEQ